MKKYTVVFSKIAEKELHKLPSGILSKMLPAIQALEYKPRPAGCKKLKGYTNLWPSEWAITAPYIRLMM